MNKYAMYGVGGLVLVLLLFFGIYQASNIAGKVTYEKGGMQSASIVVTNMPTLSEDGYVTEVVEETVEEPVIQEEEEKVEEEEELILAVEEAPTPPPAQSPEPVVEETNSAGSNTIAELQKQVDALLEQVSSATTNTTDTADESAYFLTPNGTKIDADGNVVNDDGEVEQTASTESSTENTQTTTLPMGYFRLPSGAVMGPGGIIIDEEDLIQAQQQEEQSQQTHYAEYYTLPNGTKIDAYGNIID